MMGRFVTSIQKDMILQVRNQMYTISLGLALLCAALFCFILKAEYIQTAVPAAMLLIVGGTTLIFVGGLILDEKEKGILSALILSPLSRREYLWSKIVSLTFLSTVEVGIMVGVPLLYFHYSQGMALPNLPVLFAGLVVLNLFLTVFGLGLAVRYRKITDYMVPILVIMVFLQVPILYYSRILPSPILLAIPSSAPIMIFQGAFARLALWQWIYAVGYNALLLAVLIPWSARAYYKHIVSKMR